MTHNSQARPLNQPQATHVELSSEGQPLRVLWGRSAGKRQMQLVEHVLDTWCVDDLWWSKQPLRRIYYELQLQSGARIVLSWDITEACWRVQR